MKDILTYDNLKTKTRTTSRKKLKETYEDLNGRYRKFEEENKS